MGWIFVGYAVAGYAVLFIAAAVELLRRWNPAVAALYLLILPAFAIPFGLGVFIHGTAEQRGSIRTALSQGILKRSTAFRAGGVAGGLGVALCTLAFRADGFGIGTLVIWGLTLSVAPATACAALVEHAKEALTDRRGFTPIQHPAEVLAKSPDDQAFTRSPFVPNSRSHTSV
jgi:hypothetical protein